MEVSSILHNLAAFLPGEKLGHTEYEVGSPQSWSECYDEEKNRAPTKIQTSVHPVCSLFIILYQYSIKLKLYYRQHSGGI